MIKSHSRGHEIYHDGNDWRFSDTGEIATTDRPCAKCGEGPTPEGYDPCLGYVPGVTSACCGHGVEEPYVMVRESIRQFQAIKTAARQVLNSFDKDRDKLSHSQWKALEELEDAVYGQGE